MDQGVGKVFNRNELGTGKGKEVCSFSKKTLFPEVRKKKFIDT
jgi:hypothetical protein